MHPFHRFYPVHNHLPQQGSLSNGRKELARRDKADKSGSSDDEDNYPAGTSRKKSPSRMRKMRHRTEHAESTSQMTIPIVRIGHHETEGLSKSPNKSQNILKAKEEALWSNYSMESDDNTKRLGPNTNNIIFESLQNSAQ